MENYGEPWIKSGTWSTCAMGSTVLGGGTEILRPLCAECLGDDPVMSDRFIDRMIACVNACRGIPTERLEQCVIRANFADADRTKNIIEAEISGVLDEAREVLSSKGLLLDAPPQS